MYQDQDLLLEEKGKTFPWIKSFPSFHISKFSIGDRKGRLEKQTRVFDRRSKREIRKAKMKNYFWSIASGFIVNDITTINSNIGLKSIIFSIVTLVNIGVNKINVNNINPNIIYKA